jgi:hypothetical protein
VCSSRLHHLRLEDKIDRHYITFAEFLFKKISVKDIVRSILDPVELVEEVIFIQALLIQTGLSNMELELR